MMFINFATGMTVQELKDILSDWPTKHDDGTPTTVHFKSDGYGECEAVAVLDFHSHTDEGVGNLIISPFFEE